ncbi:MAG TPA: RICIN domain-containing protein [Cellvibrionaceae bacterium]
MLIRLILATLAAVSSVASLANEVKPEGYQKLCSQGDTCALPAPNLVAFGGSGAFVYKVQAGTFICDLHAFGRDPAPNQTKTCSIPPIRPKVTKVVRQGSSSSSSSGLPVVTTSTLAAGRYAIVSRRSGKALEITTDGQIVQNQLNSTAPQIWEINSVPGGYYAIKSVKTGLSLSLVDWQIGEGARINQSQWTDSHSQHWNLSSTGNNSFSVVSRFSGKALDVVALNTQDQAPVRLWTYWGGDNQQWQFVKISSN